MNLDQSVLFVWEVCFIAWLLHLREPRGLCWQRFTDAFVGESGPWPLFWSPLEVPLTALSLIGAPFCLIPWLVRPISIPFNGTHPLLPPQLLVPSYWFPLPRSSFRPLLPGRCPLVVFTNAPGNVHDLTWEATGSQAGNSYTYETNWTQEPTAFGEAGKRMERE